MLRAVSKRERIGRLPSALFGPCHVCELRPEEIPSELLLIYWPVVQCIGMASNNQRLSFEYH